MAVLALDQRIIRARERGKEALKLRKENHTYDEIAEKLNYADSSAAYKAVARAIRDIPSEEANELRAIELAKLDALERAWWPLATTPKASSNDKGDETITVSKEAVGVVFRTMEHRAKLVGLYKPVKPEATTPPPPPLPTLDVKQLSDEQLRHITRSDFTLPAEVEPDDDRAVEIEGCSGIGAETPGESED